MKVLGRRLDHRIARGVERDDADRIPVSGVSCPAARVFFPCALVERMTSLQDGVILACVSLRRADVADGAVAVIVVVPLHERACPLPRLIEAREALRRELGRYLAVRNSDSTKALSSLTRGREYEALSPSQFIIARTVVALSGAPLSPCSTGL